MPLSIEYASESDMERLMEVQFAAMAQEPYHHVLFPGPNTSLARAQAGARTLADWKNDPSEKVLKVIDTETSEIVSFGKWNVYTHERPRSEWDQHMDVNWTDDPVLKSGAETYLEKIHGMRHKYASGQPHLLLNIMITDPPHQRRGAASMIVKWGCEKADELGLPAYLEATAAGLPIYLKEGFEKLDEVIIDCDAWPGGLGPGGTGKHRYAMLYRPARRTSHIPDDA
ncbi:hypothetical protein ACLMJK_009367 [Lecanora helva]